MKDRFEWNGYAYDTKAEWEEAKKEEESIRYIKAKTNLSDPDKALKIYQGLVEKRTFVTPVGTGFLTELRSSILRSGVVPAEELPGVPVVLPRRKGRSVAAFEQENQDKNRMMADYYRGRLKNAHFAIVLLIAVIIAMFLITMFGPNTPFVDAEVKLQDKYAAWEQELTERENAVRAKEQELKLYDNND